MLSAMLIKDGEAIPKIMSIISDLDFYREEHRIIYRAILKLYTKKIIPNALSLIESLRQSGELDKVGINLVMALAEMNFTTAYAEAHANKIKEKSVLRSLINVGEEITAAAYEDKKPVEDLLDEAEKKVFAISLRKENSEVENISPIVQRTFEHINYLVQHKGVERGISSTFVELDQKTNGWQPSDLILIAARPSMGKTAFALNLALNAALKNHSVLIFSLEMSKEQLGNRLLSTVSGINSLDLLQGNLQEPQINEVLRAMEHIQTAKLFIDDTAGISVTELRSKARRLKSENGLDLIVIDYLQLMEGQAKRLSEMNRQQEISEISRNLKALARELKVPVIALSQLSRNVELRAEKKPQLSDLRESGSLEQDADMVLFLYRDEYYNQESDKANTAEVILAKNRNGPTGTATLHFQKECMRFGNYAKDES